MKMKKEKEIKESGDLAIVPFEPKYSGPFRALNAEWISTYFKMEDKDYQSFDTFKTISK
ncbi:hypothetical protein HDE68_004942 [Pedobacter cryoconitis]|uniref:Uncharacterized protein n=1 Tax=Pedobacter cryoconitis TaxID=188932 RepID=A0A7W8ZRS1_9SPHI|nr:hypothetical protein [Pedobacter cryoconitis]MBB5639004.1 hypothetical protein [Pedobacter cryoconitis]